MTAIRFLLVIFGAAALALSSIDVRADAPAAGKITYAGGDGSTEAKAVLIQGADSDSAATHSEYVYLAEHFPKYKMIMQSLLNDNKKYYDRLDFADADGKKHSIYFDITASFLALDKSLQK